MCRVQRSAAVGFAPVRLTQQGKGRSSAERDRLPVSFSSPSVRAPRVPRSREFRTLKAEICSHRCGARLLQSRKERRLEPGHSNVGWRSHVQVRVEGPTSIIRHQNFHLAFRKVLDVLVERTRFCSLHIDCPSCLLIFFKPEELPSLHGQVAPRDLMLRRGPQKIAGCFLVAGSQCPGCVRGTGKILSEPSSY